MKTLIVSATINEIEPLLKSEKFFTSNETENLFESTDYDVFISGISSVLSIYNLLNLLHKKTYRLVINAGIAGAYNQNLKIGDIVFVKQDLFADIGIDDNGIFKTLTEEKLINSELKYTSDILIKNNKTKQVNAITVNTTSGSVEIIKKWKQKYNPDIETMEGAAIMLVCKKQQIKIIQIRAISNFVEPRNKQNWNIGLAINNLNDFLKNNVYLYKK